MKHARILSLLIALSCTQPLQAQQVNVYSENYCYMNIEQYFPGYYDTYGNYVQGYVNRNRNRVPCGDALAATQRGSAQPAYYRQRICNPTAGAAMGAGLAEALSGGNGWRSSSNWTRNYTRNSSSGSYNYSSRNYKSNGWSLFGAGLGALMYSC